MSDLLKDLEKRLAALEDAHTKNQAVYHKLQKQKVNIDQKVRQACEAASNSANELEALQGVVAKLRKQTEAEAA